MSLTPGIHKGIAAADYHADPAASRSVLHKLASGYAPAYVRREMLASSADTDGTALGTALHTAVFEPERYDETVKLGPVNEKTGKTYGRDSAKFQAAMADDPGATLLTTEQAAKILPMVASLRAHPRISKLGESVENTELTVVADLDLWSVAKDANYTDYEITQMAGPDPWPGDPVLRVRVRLDGYTPAHAGVITDLKTMSPGRRPGMEGLPHSAAAYGYFEQAGLYTYVAARAGLQVAHFTIAAIETDDPYLCFMARVSDEGAAAGLRRLVPAMFTMARCITTGEWPGYSTAIIDLEPPSWFLKEEWS